MYIGKSVGPRTEPWGTPALTRYSYEDFPFRTTQSLLLLRKEETGPNIWPEIQLRRKFVKKTSMPKPVKGIGYIRPVKSPKNSIRYNSKKICSQTVDREDLKLYWKSEKSPHFSRRSAVLLFTSFSKTLITTERRLTER